MKNINNSPIQRRSKSEIPANLSSSLASKAQQSDLLNLKGLQVNLADFPIQVPEISDSARIQRAHDSIVATGKRGVLKIASGIYSISSQVTINIGYVSLLADGVVFDTTSLASGVAFYITSTNSSSTQDQATANLRGFYLHGDLTQGRGVTGTIGMKLDSAGSIGASYLKVENVSIQFFDTDIYLGNQTYNVDFIGCNVGKSNICVSMPSGLTNYGERITFIGCTFANSNTLVQAYNPNGEFVFIGCSFDYPSLNGGSALFFDINGQQVFCYGCHIEGDPSKFTNAPIKVVGSGGTFTMHGGKIIFGTQTATIQYVFDVETTQASGGGVFLSGVFMYNTLTTTNYLATGTGNIVVRDYISYDNGNNPKMLSSAMNLLSDGGFEQTTIKDNIFVSDDTATITNRVTGTNITLATDTSQFHSGSRSLKITKIGGASSKAKFAIAVPVSHGSHAFAELYYKKPGTGTGNVFISSYWATLAVTGDGVPYFMNQSSSLVDTTLAFTSSIVDWTKVTTPTNAPTKRKPSWATHFVVIFNMDSFTADSLFIDDVVITEM